MIIHTTALTSELQQLLKPMVNEWGDDFWSLESVAQTMATKSCHLFLYTDHDKVSAKAFLLFRDAIDSWELLFLFTPVAYRGSGFAKKTLSYGMQTLTEVDHKKIFLEVRPSNKAAIALYEHVGFKTESIRKKYYKDQEDAVIMSRPATKEIP